MMKYYVKFLSLTRSKQIALVVCLVHFCLLFALVIHHFASRKLRPPRPMVIRTFSMPQKEGVCVEEVKRPAAPTKTSAEKAAAPAKKTEPVITTKTKPTAAPLAKKTESKPVSAPVAAKTAPQAKEEKPQTINREAAESRPKLTIPSKIQSKTEIAPSKQEMTGDPTYGEFLIAFLQNSLDLPEIGEVRARIEIDRHGYLIECEILETKSRKNAEFLKNRLPELTFPCLNDSPHSFTITFRNVENH